LRIAVTGDFGLSVGWDRARYGYRSIRSGKAIATPGVQKELSLQSLRVSL
jgi:hypothetical protein